MGTRRLMVIRHLWNSCVSLPRQPVFPVRVSSVNFYLKCPFSQFNYLRHQNSSELVEPGSDTISNVNTTSLNISKYVARDINISELVARAIKGASKIDKMATAIPNSVVRKRVELFVDLGAKEEEIVKIFSTKPQLLSTPNLEFLVKGLNSYNLKKHVIVEMLSKNDEFHTINVSDIEMTFETLRSAGLWSESIIMAFKINPNIIKIPSKKILQRVNELKSLFRSDDVCRLIKISPNILLESMEDINKKFMYIFETMGVRQKQMMYSHLFQHSLQHVITRHVFLERSGIFKKEKKQNLNIPTSNPYLSDIIDLTNKNFVQKFNVSMKDYLTFCKLMEKELFDASDDDDEEDDVDDDEVRQ